MKSPIKQLNHVEFGGLEVKRVKFQTNHFCRKAYTLALSLSTLKHTIMSSYDHKIM